MPADAADPSDSSAEAPSTPGRPTAPARRPSRSRLPTPFPPCRFPHPGAENDPDGNVDVVVDVGEHAGDAETPSAAPGPALHPWQHTHFSHLSQVDLSTGSIADNNNNIADIDNIDNNSDSDLAARVQQARLERMFELQLQQQREASPPATNDALGLPSTTTTGNFPPTPTAAAVHKTPSIDMSAVTVSSVRLMSNPITRTRTQNHACSHPHTKKVTFADPLVTMFIDHNSKLSSQRHSIRTGNSNDTDRQSDDAYGGSRRSSDGGSFSSSSSGRLHHYLRNLDLFGISKWFRHARQHHHQPNVPEVSPLSSIPSSPPSPLDLNLEQPDAPTIELPSSSSSAEPSVNQPLSPPSSTPTIDTSHHPSYRKLSGVFGKWMSGITSLLNRPARASCEPNTPPTPPPQPSLDHHQPDQPSKRRAWSHSGTFRFWNELASSFRLSTSSKPVSHRQSAPPRVDSDSDPMDVPSKAHPPQQQPENASQEDPVLLSIQQQPDTNRVETKHPTDTVPNNVLDTCQGDDNDHDAVTLSDKGSPLSHHTPASDPASSPETLNDVLDTKKEVVDTIDPDVDASSDISGASAVVGVLGGNDSDDVCGGLHIIDIDANAHSHKRIDCLTLTSAICRCGKQHDSAACLRNDGDLGSVTQSTHGTATHAVLPVDAIDSSITGSCIISDAVDVSRRSSFASHLADQHHPVVKSKLLSSWSLPRIKSVLQTRTTSPAPVSASLSTLAPTGSLCMPTAASHTDSTPIPATHRSHEPLRNQKHHNSDIKTMAPSAVAATDNTPHGQPRRRTPLISTSTLVAEPQCDRADLHNISRCDSPKSMHSNRVYDDTLSNWINPTGSDFDPSRIDIDCNGVAVAGYTDPTLQHQNTFVAVNACDVNDVESTVSSCVIDPKERSNVLRFLSYRHRT